MHIKRVTLYFRAQIAHFVPCLHPHVHCKYEVTESNQTRYMYAQSALVLDLTCSCALKTAELQQMSHTRSLLRDQHVTIQLQPVQAFLQSANLCYQTCKMK